MKFLIDNALSPVISKTLNKIGYDAIHVQNAGLGSSSDKEIFDYAFKENRTIISADTDFVSII